MRDELTVQSVGVHDPVPASIKPQKLVCLSCALLVLAIAQPALAVDPVLGFAVGIGSANGDSGYAITTDGLGNIYTAGTFGDTVDFDPGPGVVNISSVGGADIFVQKLNLSGDLVWVRSIGAPIMSGQERANDIAVDSAGNVYLTGQFYHTLDLDPGAGIENVADDGDGDSFVLKLDSTGNFVWARSMGGPNRANALAIAVDASGNVYTTGDFTNTADFDPGPGTAFATSSGGNSVYVHKMDTDGNFIWVSTVDARSAAAPQDIAVDGLGNVLSTGYFNGTVDFNPGPGTFFQISTPSGFGFVGDVFILKLNAGGDFVWAGAMGGSGIDTAYGIAVDGAGSVLTTGIYAGTADFDPGPDVYNLGGGGIFVQKVNAAGNLLWAKSMGGSAYEEAQGIAVDRLANVYTTGRFGATVDFDPGPGTFDLSSASSSDMYVQKLTPSGDFVWAVAMHGTSPTMPTAITVDDRGYVSTTGTFFGTTNFDPGPGWYFITNNSLNGNGDYFVSKIVDTATQSLPAFTSEGLAMLGVLLVLGCVIATIKRAHWTRHRDCT